MNPVGVVVVTGNVFYVAVVLLCWCGMLLLYFPKKCCFLSGYCSWAINEVTSACVYVREREWQRENRRRDEVVGGSLIIPLLQNDNSLLPFYNHISVCVKKQLGFLTKQSGQPVQGLTYIVRPSTTELENQSCNGFSWFQDCEGLVCRGFIKY